jgi:hypothetical protein
VTDPEEEIAFFLSLLVWKHEVEILHAAVLEIETNGVSAET